MNKKNLSSIWNRSGEDKLIAIYLEVKERRPPPPSPLKTLVIARRMARRKIVVGEVAFSVTTLSSALLCERCFYDNSPNLLGASASKVLSCHNSVLLDSYSIFPIPLNIQVCGLQKKTLMAANEHFGPYFKKTLISCKN